MLSKYGYDIFKACQNVTTRYSRWRYQGNTGFQQIERVFAYELYHQIRLIMLNNENRYNHLQLNGEINKGDRNLTLDGCGYSGTNEIIIGKLGNRLRVSPDIVLHRSQNNREFAWQKVIVEIKTGDDNSQHDIFDIIKLLNFIEQLNFENAIFIAVNKDKGRLCNFIRESFRNSSRESFSRCSIVFYQAEELDYGDQLKPKVNYKSIEEIIRNR